MISGLKKVGLDHRDYDFHRSFGTTLFDINSLPLEYSADAGFPQPNQNALGYPYACTGFAQTDLCSDEDKVIYDAVELYKNTPPYSLTEGRDLRDSLKVLVNRGPKTPEGVLGAKRAFYSIRASQMDFFDAIRAALYLTKDEKRAASVGIPWYNDFERAGTDGILPAPSDFSWKNASAHNAVVSGWTYKNTKGQAIRNGEIFLAVKSWQGLGFGDNGWAYLPRAAANAIFNLSGTGAFTITKQIPPSILTIRLNIISKILSIINVLLDKWKIMPKSNGVHNAIYVASKEAIGKRMTLNDSVPAEVGCAEAVSAVLKNAGVMIPDTGISGTWTLYQWLVAHFTQIQNPQSGCVIISPTGTSWLGSSHGHTGIVMDYGVCSNDSQSGLWRENYTLESWKQVYGQNLGFPVYYFVDKI